jgi:hypothetical protein
MKTLRIDGRIFLPPGAAVKIFQPLARRRGRFGPVDWFERHRHPPAFFPLGETGLNDRLAPPVFSACRRML